LREIARRPDIGLRLAPAAVECAASVGPDEICLHLHVRLEQPH
jgi:hypothetical protein